MKKNDLKKIIKPLVKECINEILIEEGLLSNVVSEVAAGLSGNVITESAPPRRQQRKSEPMAATAKKSKKQINQYRQQLMDSIGADAYNGVDLFEGTDPMNNYESSTPKPGAVDLGDPRDAGVNINSLLGDASKIWQAMK